MLHLSSRCVENHFLAAGDWSGNSLAFPSNSTEVSGEAVEIVLAVDLERMMMALGALEPNTQEKLADHRRQLVGLPAIAEHDDGAVVPGAPLGRDDFPDELVVRLVLAEGVTQEGVESEDCLDADVVRIGPHKVRPLVRPEVGIFGPIEQRID